MDTKLSFDEWKELYCNIDESMVSELEKFHEIDARAEIDKIAHQEYEQYLKNS